MRLFAIAVLSGTLFVQHASSLPEPRLALAGAAALLATVLVRRGVVRLALACVAGVLVGCGYAAWRAELRLADELAFAWEGADIHVTGVVAELPQVRSRATRFVFHVEEVATPSAVVPRRISLGWYPHSSSAGRVEPPVLLPGERWSFTVRLKRIRGLANPHGFDFEPWALERGLRATGYVRARPEARRLAARIEGWPQSLHRWRAQLREGVHKALAEAPLAGVVVALALGDQEAIAPAHWDVFWRTGVGHLMSISGLHITMLAAFAYAIAFAAWARVPALALRLPTPKAAIAAGALVALAYALMTGFAVPAQRTVVMLGAVAACVLVDRHGSASRALAFALLAVLFVDPWAGLSSGFWLSFGAVAAIFYAMALRTGSPGRLHAAVAEQAAVTLVMLPLVVALFQEYSLVSPAANAVAIPVVSWVVVPLAIAGAFLGIEPALHAAHAALAFLMPFLEALSSWPYAMLETHAPAGWTVAAALVGCAWLLAPRGVPLRALGFLWLAPLFAFAPARPGLGEAWLDILDVGNGLAVVVRTAEHALVYDAGPSWGDESDSGDRIVVPFLRGEGIRRLDALVVSHADDDHAGGAISVAALREPAWLLSSLGRDDAIHGLVPRSTRCASGQSWVWDGVEFRVLHPDAVAPAAAVAATGRGPRPRKPNDESCVLRIVTGGGCVLLTGDVEARGEAEMLVRDRDSLRCQVLVVPHHGSRTSSTPGFVDAVAPIIGLVSVGHRNRFRHPSELVVLRYAERGIVLRRTDAEGALHLVLPADSLRSITVAGHAGQMRYWSDRWRVP